jgi:tetratricopeptide (TPR) repeat protein
MARAWLVLAILVFLTPAVRAANAEKAAEAAAAFESLYGADLKRVRATRDPKDDLELATRLLAAARQAAGQPEFLAVLCENACDLALASPDGYATAAEAVQLEAATVPEKALACADRLVEVRQRQFDVAKGDARAAAGEALIDAILAALDAQQKTGAVADGLAYYKRATTVARAVKSDRAAALDARLKDLEQAARLAAEIESLKKQLAASPQNPAVRLRLVRLLLVDLDDPAEAAKYIEGVQDAALAKYVPAAAKPLEEAPELACLELGDWYRGLAETAPPAAKGPMFARAKAYYKRFLEVHPTEDINRAKAQAALQKIEAEAQAAATKSSPPPAKTPAKVPVSGQWIDLLALVDLPKDAGGGSVARQGAAVAVTGTTACGLVVLPVVVQGNYELEVKLARTAGDDTVGVALPVGNTAVVLDLSHLHGKQHGLENVNGHSPTVNETAVRPGALDNGRAYLLIAKVTAEGDEAQIIAMLDGRPLVNWRGPQSALSLPRQWGSQNPRVVSLGTFNSTVVLQSARLKMLSGEARPLRSVEKPAAATGKMLPRTKEGPGAQPIDLLALVDPDACVVSGRCRREGEAIVVSGRIMLPVIVSGSYDLTVALKRTGGGDTVGIILPVGAKTVLLGLGYYGNSAHGLDQVNGKNGSDPSNPTVLKPAKLENNREYVAHARVLVEGGLADIQVDLDGTKIISWNGSTSAFTMYEGWRLPQPNRIGLGVSNGSAVFSSARLVMLSGQAKVLAPAEAK